MMASPRARSQALFEVREVAKTFGATRALADVSFVVAPGEVHGLLGANGSGKSTLLKIISGVQRADVEPWFSWHGDQRTLPADGDACRRYGWGFVHQDLSLLPTLRIVDNFHMSGPLGSPAFALSWRREIREVAKALDALELDLDPTVRIADLPRPTVALVAIARAMHDARGSNMATNGRCVLFLDESTVSLEADDRAELRRVVDGLTASGSAVVIVSHDLDEVRELTDRVTVLRNGRVVASEATQRLSHRDLLSLVVGPAAESMPTATPLAPAGPRASDMEFEVDALTGQGLRSVSFACRSGEIVGMTGLVGSGFEKVPHLLFGDAGDDAASGAIQVGGKRLDIRRLRPYRAIANGICVVPGDRGRQGIFAQAPIWQNVTAPRLETYLAAGRRLQRHRERDAARAATRTVGMVPPDVDRKIGELSGGNQQKAVLAKWLNAGPRVLILDEPTIGIDVGARTQIHSLLRETANEGMVVVCASSDHEQLEALCDRVLVFRHGRIHAELTGTDVTAHRMATESMTDSEAEA